MDDQKEPLIDESQEPADEELKEHALDELVGGSGGGGTGPITPHH
jgi:hypothetical protein